jgi:hypothetical protein
MRRLVALALVLKASAAFAADASLASPTGDVYEVEFRFRADALAAGVPSDPDGIAALNPATLASGNAGFLAWGGGAWHEVFAEGVVPSTNDWTQAKFAVRTVDGEKLVSYLVLSNGNYVRLRTAGGQGWFRASSAALAPDMVFDGPGVGEVIASLSEDSGEEFSLDVSRPKVGSALAPQLPSLFAGEGFSFAWQRAAWDKTYAAEPVASVAEYTPTTEDYGHWLCFSVLDAGAALLTREFYFSKLPVCYITTDDGEFPSAQKEKHDGSIRIQGNAEFKEQYNGKMTVNVRGNTSAGYAKKPYKLKLDKKTSPFGLGSSKSKHWVLLANMPDMSNMRNKLAFDFAASIGVLAMESTWVDVVVNGRFDGLYQFCEHVRIAADRVPVFDWEGYSEDNGHTAEDLSWIDPEQSDVNGGWIFEFSNEMDEVSRFTITSGNLRMLTMVNSPEFLNTNGDMFNAAKRYLQNYFDACTSSTRKSPEGRHYSAYCDVDSMVGYFLVQELFGNQDAGAKSRYAYKDIGKKMFWGPVWDFDHAAGTANMQKPSPERWHAAQGSMYCEWLSDYRFARRVLARYNQVRGAYAALAAEGGLVDSYAEYLRESAAANDARWPQARTFAQDTVILKNFIAGHRAWLDEQFKTVTTLMESVRCESQTRPWDGVVIPEPTVISLQ